MNLLITGATGVLATQFIQKYHYKYNITALSRGNAAKLNPNVRYVKVDYINDDLLNLFSGQDCILHLAAARLFSGGDCKNNLMLDERILEAAYRANCKKIIYMSSRGVYGNQKSPWHEYTPVAPLNEYALAKAQSDVLVQYYINSKNMNIASLRLAQVFSDEEFKGGLLNTFFENAKAGIDLNVSTLGGKREYIYIQDVISAINEVVIQSFEPGIYNLGSEEVCTIESMAKSISRAFPFGSKVKVLDDPDYSTEYSLMDSTKFYSEFNWRPSYTLETAAIDIASKYERV